MSRTHGRSGTREHRSWKGALNRCSNPNSPKYARYGGRGIRVCDEWRENFSRFLSDMGPCPIGYTLDRFNNDANYAPGNCRWASPRQQSNNTRRNVRVLFDGREQTIAEWAREKHFPMQALWLRLRRHRWSIERALTKPLRPHR